MSSASMQTDETDEDRKHLATAIDLVQDALNRLHRAQKRGTGCHLTADMIHALSITAWGEMWQQDDPRDESASAQSKGE